MKLTTCLSASAVVALLAAGSSASAASYPSLAGTSVGVWVNPSEDPAPPAAIYSGQGTSLFSWGKVVPGVLPADGGVQSSLLYTPLNFTELDFGGPPVGIAELTYINGRNLTGFSATGIDLEIELQLEVSLNGVDPAIPLVVSDTLSFALNNTPNEDLPFDPLADDVVSLLGDAGGNAVFDLGNGYKIIVTFGFAEGGLTDGTDFIVSEGGTGASLIVLATLVPEAETWAAGFGLAGLAALGVYRRRQAKK